MSLFGIKGMLDKLNKINSYFEEIQRALEKYLETKRYLFPRFYFISNEDLLEILANSRKPDLIQPHLKKLFCAINKLKFVRVSVCLSVCSCNISLRPSEELTDNNSAACFPGESKVGKSRHVFPGWGIHSFLKAVNY